MGTLLAQRHRLDRVRTRQHYRKKGCQKLSRNVSSQDGHPVFHFVSFMAHRANEKIDLLSLSMGFTYKLKEESQSPLRGFDRKCQ